MPGLKENLEGDEIRCLIYESGNSDAVGFIEASTNMDNHKEIGIARIIDTRKTWMVFSESIIYMLERRRLWQMVL